MVSCHLPSRDTENLKKQNNITVLAFHAASFSENEKIVESSFALEIVLNILIFFHSDYINLEIFSTALCLFNAKNL